ncbi:MAG: hypothetical protein EXS00_00480 [Phycisphaerales bacterium]|nr:hypothetical protein [Phycisphaerales bacterium]
MSRLLVRTMQHGAAETILGAVLASVSVCSGVEAAPQDKRFVPDTSGPFDVSTLQQAVPREDDMGALSASLRQPSTDLAQPSGFRQLYRVPGRPDLLMRANGAVFVVFSQSVYQRWKGRDFAVIPPGATFTIGVPTQQFLDSIPFAKPRSGTVMVDGRAVSASELRMNSEMPSEASLFTPTRVDRQFSAKSIDRRVGAGEVHEDDDRTEALPSWAGSSDLAAAIPRSAGAYPTDAPAAPTISPECPPSSNAQPQAAAVPQIAPAPPQPSPPSAD